MNTKRGWLICGHVALDKCDVSRRVPWIPEPSTVNNKLKRREGSGLTESRILAGQQVKNCCPPRPATYINKQNGGTTRKFMNYDFPSLC
jgi:hypothetical protein